MLKWTVIGLIVLWIICMWYVVIYAAMKGWGPYLRSKRQEKVRVRVRVAEKLGAQEMSPFEWKMELVRKALVFECEDGEEREYEVHDDLWDWAEVGDSGELTYQGDLFAGFDSDRPREQPEKFCQRLKTLIKG